MQNPIPRLKLQLDGMAQQLRPYGCLLITAILAFATWSRYSHWPRIFDIGLWDETNYLSDGLYHTFDFSNYELSPLYSAYYYAIGRFVHDALKLYMIGGLIIQLLTLYIIGFVAWMLSRSLAVGIVIFGLMLCSPFLLVWPRVSYLAVILVVLGVWLASLESSLINRLALTLLMSFTVSFIRPEFVISMYLASGALLAVLVRSTMQKVYRAIGGWTKVEDSRSLFRLVVYLSITVLLSLTWSFPVVKGGQRAMMAFGQHYALRWVSDHNSDLNPWLNYKSITDRMFPGAKTPMQALFAHPSEWLHFTIQNIFGIAPAIRGLLFVRNNIVIGMVLAVVLLGLLSLSVRSMHNRVQDVGLSNVLKTLPLIESGVYAVAPLSALVLVYPDAHYAVLLLAALMPCCFAVGRWHSWSKMSDLFVALLAGLAIAAAARPLPAIGQPTLTAIVSLRKLNLPIHRMLELDGGWCAYLSPPCISEDTWNAQKKPALEIVIEKNVDAIMVDGSLIQFLRDRHDHSLNGLSKTEWHRYEIRGWTGSYLLYRETHP